MSKLASRSTDEYFEPSGAEPLVTTAAVRWICCTVVLLVVIALVAVFAWHRPDDAISAATVLWADAKGAIGVIVFIAVVLLFMAMS